MKLAGIIGLFPVLFAVSCGSSKSSSDNTTATPWTNTSMQTLVANKCATSGCHNGSQSPNYKGISESAMKADTSAKSDIASKKMPQGSTLTAAELETATAFYK